MWPGYAPLTGMAPASLILRWALIFRDRRQRNRAQIEPTKFPVEAGLPASRARIPVLSRPDGPCDALRRTDPAATACARIARLGRPTAQSLDATRFGQAVRERLTCRSAENPTSPREQSWPHAPLSERPERSPHNYRRQCGRLPSPLTDRTDPGPGIVGARRAQS